MLSAPGLQVAGAPFQPTLSTQPNDFTIAISYIGAGLNTPQGVAIDASGNPWVASVSSSLSKFGPTGAAISGSSGYTGGGLDCPIGIAIDASGNVWAANANAASISEFNSSGAELSGSSGYTGGGLHGPVGIAIDGSGNVWVTNGTAYSTNIAEYVGAATPVVTPVVANLKSPYGQHAVNRP